MKLLQTDNVVFFDVDDTLVEWEVGKDSISEDAVMLQVEQDIKTVVFPIYEHIEALKNHYFRGHTVVVWSAGGYNWARAVVEGLGLSQYVELVMCKPKWLYDDKPLSTLGKRVYKGKEYHDECK